MKKLLLVAALAAIACSTQASLILSNSFAYPDGPLVGGSVGSPLGVWVTHSGTANQVDVLGGVVNLTGTEGEDVSTVLTNATYPTAISNGTVYASFDLNVSALPTAAVYFAHFKGTSTDFRARIFINTSATPGKFRVGIVNGSATSAAYVPLDLDPGVTYKLVLRFVDAATATLWVDPNAESNTANQAIGTDTITSGFAGCYYWAWRQSGNMGTFTVDNLLIGTTFDDVAVSGGAPSISPIPDQSIAANASTGPIGFTVADVETPAQNLIVTATSDNTALIPNNPANLVLGGTGSDRTITVIPSAGQQGVANILVLVTDGDSLSTSESFQVVVGSPGIDPIASQMTRVGTAFAPVGISVSDAETPNSLIVTATSGNQALISDSGLVISGTGTSRTLQITAEPGQTGVAVITVSVSDSVHTVNTTFKAAVSPSLGLILADTFTYPDGVMQESSGYFWLAYSGSDSNDLFVAEGKVQLGNTNYQDVHAFYSNSITLGANSGAILYSSFKVNFNSLPVGSGGGYFAFFKDSGTSQFRARVFAQTNGAAPGKFRLAISNGGFSQQNYPQDLSLGTEYTVVTRYNTLTGLATLWVNPANESGASVSGIDYANVPDLMTYAFRQDRGDSPGVITVDDLAVGTSWSDVYSYVPPDSIPLDIVKNGDGSITLNWSNPAFKLQERSSLSTGSWTTLEAATTGYTVSATGSKFYRLIAQP